MQTHQLYCILGHIEIHDKQTGSTFKKSNKSNKLSKNKHHPANPAGTIKRVRVRTIYLMNPSPTCTSSGVSCVVNSWMAINCSSIAVLSNSSSPCTSSRMNWRTRSLGLELSNQTIPLPCTFSTITPYATLDMLTKCLHFWFSDSCTR